MPRITAICMPSPDGSDPAAFHLHQIADIKSATEVDAVATTGMT
jgi:hypothetical protein